MKHRVLKKIHIAFDHNMVADRLCLSKDFYQKRGKTQASGWRGLIRLYGKGRRWVG